MTENLSRKHQNEHCLCGVNAAVNEEFVENFSWLNQSTCFLTR